MTTMKTAVLAPLPVEPLKPVVPDHAPAALRLS
jgi:hypothetical protein